MTGACRCELIIRSMPSTSESRTATLAATIAARLRQEETRLRREWESSSPVRHFVLDDVLPSDELRDIYARVPPTSALARKQSLREHKWVGVQIDKYDPAVGECLLAFQEPEVVAAISRITGLAALEPDPSLYASGISVMEHDDFLNPHLDNSHDGDQRKYRALNLLYYASPGWTMENGGNLELWTTALDVPRVVESRFNRLVVMLTNDASWHSVQRVTAREPRVCFSNYYFSELSPADHAYRNVTSFRGRPEEPLKRAVLRADAALLNALGRAMPFLLKRNPHRR